MQHSTEYTVDGQETVAAITMTVVVVNENPFSPALSAVPFLTLNDTGVGNGFLSRNDYKKHLDSEGAWVIKGGIRGPQAQRAVPGGTGAKTVHLLRKQSPRVPALAIQEAPGGGTEDRQREKFPGSGQWGTHRLRPLERHRSLGWEVPPSQATLSISVSSTGSGDRLTLGRDLPPPPSSWDCAYIVAPLWASVS